VSREEFAVGQVIQSCKDARKCGMGVVCKVKIAGCSRLAPFI